MPRVFHKRTNENIQPIERIYQPVNRIFWNNFIGGIAWSLGATIGLAIVVGIVTSIFGQFVNFPIIGEKISEILEATNQTLQKR